MANLKELKAQNLSEQVYSEIRSALMEGQYEPGERLRISQLADQLGVSITPVREAIFRLVSEQALEMKAGTAVFVSRLGAEQLSEIQLIRVLLEGAAIEIATPKMDREDIETLEKIQRDFVAAAKNNPKRASQLNRQFHFYIVESAEMAKLTATIANMWTMMGPVLNLFHQSVPKRELIGNHKHEDILKALRAGDALAAKKAFQEDIQWGQVIIDWIKNREA